MGKFKNGYTVYGNTRTFYYIGKDPYDQNQSYVIDTHTGEVGTIQTASLSSEPPISLRELNGKVLYELWEETWNKVNNCNQSLSWDSLPPNTHELYMHLAEKLNYTAEE